MRAGDYIHFIYTVLQITYETQLPYNVSGYGSLGTFPTLLRRLQNRYHRTPSGITLLFTGPLSIPLYLLRLPLLHCKCSISLPCLHDKENASQNFDRRCTSTTQARRNKSDESTVFGSAPANLKC